MELNEFNLEKINTEKVKYFVASLKNTNWGTIANEKTVDGIFKCALDIQETLLQEEKEIINEELIEKYPGIDFRKAVDLLLETIIKSPNLNEHLTLYAIQKYMLVFSKSKFSDVLDNIITDVRLRECLFELNEELADVDFDLFRINNCLSEILDSRDKMLNAIQTQSMVVLNAAKHGSVLNAQAVIDEMISCLESQPDLKLWFILIKKDNLEIIMELCGTYRNFLSAVLKFFDKFADEIESNYDEDLNVKYSHLNLDFEEFVKVLEMFLNDKKIGELVGEYLNEKTISDKNFCFWVDVKSCI